MAKAYSPYLQPKLTDKISIEEKIKKSIKVGINGEWKADAVNIFQHNLRPLIMSNVDLAYEILKAKKEEEIESFFYFFFHEIHPQYKSVPDKFDSIKLTDSKFYNLIAIGHEQAIKDSGH